MERNRDTTHDGPSRDESLDRYRDVDDGRDPAPDDTARDAANAEDLPDARGDALRDEGRAGGKDTAH